VTRKHYEQVAQAFRAYHLEIVHGLGESHIMTNAKLDTVQDIGEILADIFGADNPRFDRGRFLSACVPDEMKG
jgi:hypothetical protein